MATHYMKTLNCRIVLLILLFSSVLLSCQKGGGGSTAPAETPLAVTTNPLANGHVEAPAPGPNFNVNVTITSPMPAGGVKIDLTARPDGGTVTFFSQSKTTTTPSNDFVITGATVSVISVATITVTSVNTPSNTFTGTYKFSRK
jgi:hypothetical protein